MPEALMKDAPAPEEGYVVNGLSLLWDLRKVFIWVRNPTGHTECFSYKDNMAVAMMRALNTANLSTKSLHRRILERLVEDGKLPAGTVTGSPD